MKTKNKKGQLFTIIAILLIVLTFLSFELFSFLSEKKSIQTRVSTMDDFLSSVEENLERQVYISGFRILYLAQNQTIMTGAYIPNIEAFFHEAFFNSTVNSIPETSVMPGANYTDLVESVNNKARKINVNVSLNNSQLIVHQTDPWHINLTLVSDFIMEDREELARWEKIQRISALIPINRFEDPLYIVNSYARYPMQPNQTIYEGNYGGGNLLSHVEEGYYAANPKAPSFLKRCEGDLSPDENGIESFVNVPALDAQIPERNLVPNDKTVIDYIYFDVANNPTPHPVLGMPSTWFRIDSIDNHTEKYGV